MGIPARCALWLSAWCIFLHLVFTLIPVLAHLPTFAKLIIALGLTAFGSVLAYGPITDMWSEDRASALTGRLRPQSNVEHADVFFEIGPNAKATFKWTGKPDEMQWGNMGTFIAIKRGASGELLV